MASVVNPKKMRRAERLRDARKAAGLSQEAAALRVGTSRRHWIRWENGESSPNPVYLDRIAEVLGDSSLRDTADDDEEAAPVGLSLAHELQTLASLAALLERNPKLLKELA